ncbi:MAG: 23S rRNA (adenine(2503)-C(2))-methyltransferase RlmN [Desulfovibrionaceae bacterium]|nr:23S rRNA (adenine(2503)-C(2))-methyltransferase RlmN [Desulfovibrionaceae bacterium]
MRNILDFSAQALTEYLATNYGEPKFRATQIWQWLYQKLAQDFAAMTNIKQSLREQLAKDFAISYPEILQVATSTDGTQKLLLRLYDGALIETVLLPSIDHAGKVRYAQCLSTQVGCAMGCTFCATGALGITRNLTHAEMVGQVLIGKRFLQDFQSDKPIIKNLVFMGMGEPLLNLDNLLLTLETLNSRAGLAFSPRRITVSTCGIPKALERLGQSGLCYLAVSLHAPTQELRASLMPKAANFKLQDLLTSLKHYPLKPREYITFEYVLLQNVNSSPEHAKALAKIVRQVKGKLNLIVYNKTPASIYSPPTEAEILAFEEILWQHEITAILRQSKGQDIAAACGQLQAQYVNGS